MKLKIIFSPHALKTLFVSMLLGVAGLVESQAQPTGAINGIFSVADGQYVYFSKGNLQYNAMQGTHATADGATAQGTWRFADHQWDYVGSANCNISETYDGWIDLFGWGTSGWNSGATCYQPWSNSTTNHYYNPGGSYYTNSFNDLTGDYVYADWGVYNAISNGGNQPGLWRVLTKDEWDYVFRLRNTASGIRWAKATVNGVSGLIMLPDLWDASYYSLNGTNDDMTTFSANVIDASTWTNQLEAHGAVFFPACGFRGGSTMVANSYYYGNTYGWYFSSTHYGDGNGVYILEVNGNSYDNHGLTFADRHQGHAVRPVRQAPTLSFSINATCNPSNGGTVSGTGTYNMGATCTLTAIPNPGYSFLNWTVDGTEVFSDLTYSFTVWSSKDVVANFYRSATITAVTNPEGAGHIDGDGVYEIGNTCTLSVYAYSGYSFLNWTKDGIVVSTDENISFVVTADACYVANFSKNGYTITAWCDPYYGGTVTGGGTYLIGDTCTLTAVPAPGYYFAGWYSYGFFPGSNPYSFIVQNFDESCCALFEPIPQGYYVGDGSSNMSELLPVISCYSLTQQIYTATEIGMPGEGIISGVSFFCAKINVTCNCDVYLVHTNKNTFGGDDWIPVTEADRVFSGDVAMQQAKWVTIVFDTPFVYDGNSNLALIVNNKTGTPLYANGSLNCRVYDTPTNQAIEWEHYEGEFNPISPDGPGRALSMKNQIVFISNNYTISATANPSQGGTVTGGGAYQQGQICTLTATPNTGYSFVRWTKNGNQVSTSLNYSFTVTESASYVAEFVEDCIVFADPVVKAICIANWDTNGSGELSYAEAAAVTDLGQVFYGNTDIASFEELQFFTGLTSISYNAFNGCSGLTGALNIPNSVTTIGNSAFSGCSGFTGNLTIPNSVTTIGNSAFSGCSGFTGDLTIPNSVTKIGNSAFSGCSGFTGDLTIPNSVTAILSQTFKNCNGFTGSLTIPNSVTIIGHSAFYGCSGFTGSLIIPNSITSIDYSAFYNCSGFSGSLVISNSMTLIGNRAFYCCTGFGSMTVLAETPPSLGSDVFYNISTDIPVYVPCASLADYQSADGWSAFANYHGIDCSYFEVVATVNPTAGGTVTGTGSYESGSTCTLTATPNEGYAFVNWTENGEVVSTDATYSFTVTGDRTLVANFEAEVIIEFADALAKSICVENWDTNGDGELSVREAAAVTNIGQVFRRKHITSFEELQYFTGLTAIGYAAFGDCSYLTGNLIIPSSVTTIGGYAFDYCMFTGTLIIPNTVTYIGDNAFRGCRFSEVLTLPSSVTGMGTNPFASCNLIESIVVDSDNPAFDSRNNCNAIIATGSNELVAGCKNTVIPNSVTSIGSYAFYAVGLTNIEIPNSVTLLGNYAFYSNSGLTQITIPNSVTSMGTSVFQNCRNLVSATLSESLIRVYVRAFRNCSSLTQITLPNSIEYILDDAFYGCSSLTGTLTIPSGVKTIMGGAFYGCNFSSVVVLAETPPAFNQGNYSSSNYFSNSIKDKPIYVPCNSMEAYQAASVWSTFTDYHGIDCLTQTQTVQLSAGWNWFSTYLSGEPTELLQMLENSLGSNGIVIKSNAVSTDYYDDYGWYGDLDDEGLKSSQMYMIKTNAACTVELEGVPANPAEVGITIRHGWNWIGFPCAEAMSVADALAGFQAEDGDILKSSGASTDYYEGFGWYGELETMEPGHGFMYYSNSPATKTVYFQTGAKKSLTGRKN